MLKEQELVMEGIVNDPEVTNAGHLAGARYMISGRVIGASVTRVAGGTVQMIDGYSTTSKNVPVRRKNKKGEYVTSVQSVTTTKGKYKNQTVWDWQGSASVQLRVIDVAKGKIIYSSTKSGYAADSQTGGHPKGDPNKQKPELAIEAATAATTGFSGDFKELFKPIGYLIGINEIKNRRYELTFDVGQNFGVKRGDKLEVILKGEPIFDSVTKETLPGPEYVVASVKLVEVDPATSIGIVSADVGTKLKVGMLARLRNRKGCFF